MRKKSQSQIRKIQLSGGSCYITIPIDIIRDLGWKEKQKVVVNTSGKKVEIKDSKK